VLKGNADVLKLPKSSTLQNAIVGALSHIKAGVPAKIRATVGGPVGHPAWRFCVRYRTYRIFPTVSESASSAEGHAGL